VITVVTIVPPHSTIREAQLLVYSIVTFGLAWRPVSELNNFTYPPIVLETSDQLNEPIGAPRLLIYGSPLQCGTYKIVLHIFSREGGVGAPAVIFPYKCTVCDPGFRWTSSGADPAAPNPSVRPDRYTYSGYVQDNDCCVWRVWEDAHPDSLAKGTKTELFLPQEMHLGLHLSTYNCVVMRVLPAGSIVLSYYL
jgi:hypothetical protein